MKKLLLLTLASAVLILAMTALTSCGNDDGEQSGSAAEAESSVADTSLPENLTVNAEKTRDGAEITVEFGLPYAFSYASVTVTDKSGEVVYISQLQLGASGNGTADVTVGESGDYTVTVASGNASESSSFTY